MVGTRRPCAMEQPGLGWGSSSSWGVPTHPSRPRAESPTRPWAAQAGPTGSGSFLGSVGDSQASGWAFPCSPANALRAGGPSLASSPRPASLLLLPSGTVSEPLPAPLHLQTGPPVSAAFLRFLWLPSALTQLWGCQPPALPPWPWGFSPVPTSSQLPLDPAASTRFHPRHGEFPRQRLGSGCSSLQSQRPWGRGNGPAPAPQQHPPVPMAKFPAGGCRGT